MRFIISFVAFYALLIAPWPGLNEAYSITFRSICRAVFRESSGPRILRFEATKQGQGNIDTQITLANRDRLDANGTGPSRLLKIDSRSVGWVPTALVLALTLATPVPWPRRMAALLVGFVFVNAYVEFCVASFIWNQSAELSLAAPNLFSRALTDGLEETLVTQLGASFVVPFLIWICVAFRPSDFAQGRGPSPVPEVMPGGKQASR